MAMRIQADQCVGCGLCAEVCPMSAVRRPNPGNGPLTYEIDPARCTECVGHYDGPRCVAFCRTQAIHLDTAHFESRATLIRKWRKLTGGADYGEDAPQGLEFVEECGDCDA